MHRNLILVPALLALLALLDLTGCVSPTGETPEGALTVSQLCESRSGRAGQEIELEVHAGDMRTFALTGHGGVACDSGCCQPARFAQELGCGDGGSILLLESLAYADEVAAGSPEIACDGFVNGAPFATGEPVDPSCYETVTCAMTGGILRGVMETDTELRITSFDSLP